VIVVEAHQEAGQLAAAGLPGRLGVQSAEEVAGVLVQHPVHQRSRGDALFFGAQHDGRAVLVVGAHVVDLVAAHALEAHPDVGLDVLHQMAQVDGAVGVGQGAGDEDAAAGGGGHGAELCGKAKF